MYTKDVTRRRGGQFAAFERRRGGAETILPLYIRGSDDRCSILREFFRGLAVWWFVAEHSGNIRDARLTCLHGCAVIGDG